MLRLVGGVIYQLVAALVHAFVRTIEPLATGDGTTSLLIRGFAIRQRHAARLKLFAQSLHTGSSALKGKTVLVTGSARGLGSGIAAHLATSGAKLILPQRNGTSAAVLKEALARSGTAAIRACAADPDSAVALNPGVIGEVTSPTCGLELGSLTSIERFVDALAAAGTKIDAVINNAGMVPITDGVTSEGFEKAFGVNFLGTAHLTLTLIQRGVLAPGATIINVSSEEHRLGSLQDHQGVPISQGGQRWRAAGGAAGAGTVLGAVPSNTSMLNAMDRYAYSKLLLTTFSHELARRHADTLRVFDICPGPVASEIARDAPWPIGDVAQYGMWATFPSPADAALPVVELLLPAAGVAARAPAAVHYHMSEVKRAGARADEPEVGAWLWEQTMALIAARKPPEV